jgi:hypothetical protein
MWDTRDEQGRAIHPGVYYYRLHAGRISRGGNLVVLR